jgi:hypothetical protein
MVIDKTTGITFRGVATIWVLCFFVLGCSLRSYKDPALKTAALVGSSNAGAELLKQSTGNVFSLQIEEAKIVPDFTHDQITSVCALAFFNELSEDDRSNPCFVRVNIAQENGENLQATYSGEELKIADRCIENAAAFLRWHPSMGIDSIRTAVDSLFFPDTSLELMGNNILAQDSADNSWTRTEFMGFRQDTLAQIPVMVLHAKDIRKQNTQWYELFARYSTQQIIFVSANLKKD